MTQRTKTQKHPGEIGRHGDEANGELLGHEISFARWAGFLPKPRRIIVSLSYRWRRFSNHLPQKNDACTPTRRGRHRLRGGLFLVDAPAFVAPGRDVEGIARRDQADRETVE